MATLIPNLSPSFIPGLSPGMTQANRLLRLHTPLGAEFGQDVLLAETLKGLEGISGHTEGFTGARKRRGPTGGWA